jgi:hypothetical protein
VAGLVTVGREGLAAGVASFCAHAGNAKSRTAK